MRGKNRKPIGKRKKLPQLTTMNAIDGQAVIESYFSLIFYSLTTDNILNIIVLLILAGISISIVLGEGGIIDSARKAGEATNATIANEQQMLQNVVDWVDEYLGGNDPENLQDAVSSGKVFSNTTRYDSEGKKIDGSSEEKKAVITIPAGFKIAEGNIAQIDKGIVISDKSGNEFVWVPCTEAEYKKHDYTALKDGETDAGTNLADGESHNEGWNTFHYRAYKDWKDDGGNLDSVKKYGGFYIARYEAGIPSNATDIYVNATSDSKTYNEKRDIDTYVPVSKKGVQVWNGISQPKAKNAAKGMYRENTYVTSQLVDGTAWDRTVDCIVANSGIKDIEKDSTNYGNYANTSENFEKANGEKYKSLTISSDVLYALHLEKRNEANGGQGWNPATIYQYGKPKTGAVEPYDGDFSKNKEPKNEKVDHYRQLLELSTGASEDTKLNNIYDLAGNMYEWTTEVGYHDTSGGTLYAVRRGGSITDTDAGAPVSFRMGSMTADGLGFNNGFRVVLYVN